MDFVLTVIPIHVYTKNESGICFLLAIVAKDNLNATVIYSLQKAIVQHVFYLNVGVIFPMNQ